MLINDWVHIPAWANVDRNLFFSSAWQEKHSITSIKQLSVVLQGLTPDCLLETEENSVHRSMAIRVPPYIIARIDWNNYLLDPLRKQFIPLASDFESDHPMSDFDSLSELNDSPVEGVVHRYPKKALLLANEACPVYCRFCTRSYLVGPSTLLLNKTKLTKANPRLKKAIEYFSNNPQIEDVLVSGGDAYRLSPSRLFELGSSLLHIPSIRRLRFGTKGPAVLPMKLLDDDEWISTLKELAKIASGLRKNLDIQVHFNHVNEISDLSRVAIDALLDAGVRLRNQTVLLRGVNDSCFELLRLFNKLVKLNVEPYYVYVHDMVAGAEDLRTTIKTACSIEKQIRGELPGYLTPRFVVDLPGGGGKRDIHSYDYYCRATGISVFSSPAVKPGRQFLFFDPLRDLSDEVKNAWLDNDLRADMIRSVLHAASLDVNMNPL
ncbi:MAG TPA: KamA family radical SAM protein [Hydrogenophaga sp.]|nr:KamA family radical SAM protein [Hydrogenophaga sp.]HBU18975.1 KamA family radical SAM protein [Hydrogenophaga sp.]